jgi:hypothetical protein
VHLQGQNPFFRSCCGSYSPQTGLKPCLDPLQGAKVYSGPHVSKPGFCEDSEDFCFQERNRPFLGSKVLKTGFPGLFRAQTAKKPFLPPGPCRGRTYVLTPHVSKPGFCVDAENVFSRAGASIFRIETGFSGIFKAQPG